MKHQLIRNLSAATAASLLLASCGSYENITPDTGHQDVPAMKEYKRVSGRPNLRVPARLGIVTSGRFRQGHLDERDLAKLRQPGIASIMPVDTYVPSDGRDNMAGMLGTRAMIIDSTRHLGLDLILLCDQTNEDEEKQLMPPLQWLTLGILNPSTATHHTQLDAVLMDARTGYIYGVIGDEGKGSSAGLTFLESEVLNEASKSRAASGAKQKLVDRFPAFWSGVKAKYGK